MSNYSCYSLLLPLQLFPVSPSTPAVLCTWTAVFKATIASEEFSAELMVLAGYGCVKCMVAVSAQQQQHWFIISNAQHRPLPNIQLPQALGLFSRTAAQWAPLLRLRKSLNTATFSHPSEFHPNWRTHLFKIIFSLTGLLECFWVTYKQIYSCTGLCQGPLQQWAAAAPWAQPPNPSACRIPSPTPQSWPTEQPNSYILLLLKPKQNTTLVSLYRSSH